MVVDRRSAPNWPHVTFPHPPGRRRFVGDLPAMVRNGRGRPVQRAMEVGRGLGPIFEIKLFSQKMVLVRQAALAAELCDESRFEKKLAPGVAALRRLAGDGLFTAYSDEPNWRLAHDLLRPAFTKSAMQGYHPVMEQVARELLDKWDRGPVPDVAADLTRLTLETIGRTSFSKNFGSYDPAATGPEEELDPFVAAMVRSLRRGQRTGAFSGMPLSRLLVRRTNRQGAADNAYLEAMIDDIIDTRVAAGASADTDLLGLMLNAAHEQTGEQLDRENIRHQILTFLVAGHETTSGALSFALYYLATHPQVRHQAQQEADAILRDRDLPLFEQVAKLRYVRRVLDESLRLWPTAPGFARGPLEPTLLGGQWQMTPDDWCIVHALAVHRDPAVWGPDADLFDPDNFLPERVRARPAHTYFPFGTGERACIGRQFALHEAVLVLAAVLHRYDFDADPSYQLDVTERLTLMPKGFALTMRRRQASSGDGA